MPVPPSSARTAPRRKRVLLALSWYDTRIHAGVARFADEAGWHLNAQMAHWPVLPDDWRGDGVITMLPWSWYPARRREYLRKLKRYHAHHVNLTPGPDSQKFPTVDYDPLAVGRLAAAHLLERGFHRLAFVGPEANFVFRRIREGGEEVLARKGLAGLTADWPWGRPYAARRECARRLLVGSNFPLGVVAMKDVIAEDLLDFCHEFGRAVPDEVAVVGVDNDPLVIPYTHPALTSVDWDFEELGYQGAVMLGNLMRGERASSTVVVPPKGVVARASTDTFVSTHKGVCAVVEFIRGHFRERVGNREFCRVSGMSRPGLYAAFQAELGRSATGLLEWHRLCAAEAALRDTDDKVAAIAVECGFRTSYNLWRAFRRARGLSPEEWREAARQGKE